MESSDARRTSGRGPAAAKGADPRHVLGRHGERYARDHLERLGFAIVDANFRTRHGELDLVAFDGHTLAFVEVKSRRAGGGAPWWNLDHAKQRRVRAMARIWLSRVSDRPHAARLRFDAIGVTIDAAGRLVTLEHLEGAF